MCSLVFEGSFQTFYSDIAFEVLICNEKQITACSTYIMIINKGLSSLDMAATASDYLALHVAWAQLTGSRLIYNKTPRGFLVKVWTLWSRIQQPLVFYI